jgi:hypothetical protein
MTRARLGALGFVSLAVGVAAALAFAAIGRDPKSLLPRPPAERPTLLLLTSLPLIFADDFSLGGGSPALKRLQARYRVIPISVTSPSELAKGRLLLMAQPLAQTAENLVSLDTWVRGGGRVLLLADPLLEWPSKRPLGNPLYPPPMFADTGLLAHWGLRLDAPDDRGPARRSFAGYRILTVSPGALYGGCTISSDRLAADCAIGKGRAVIVADADFVRADGLGREASHNLDGLLAALASLERK